MTNEFKVNELVYIQHTPRKKRFWTAVDPRTGKKKKNFPLNVVSQTCAPKSTNAESLQESGRQQTGELHSHSNQQHVAAALEFL